MGALAVPRVVRGSRGEKDLREVKLDLGQRPLCIFRSKRNRTNGYLWSRLLNQSTRWPPGSLGTGGFFSALLTPHPTLNFLIAWAPHPLYQSSILLPSCPGTLLASFSWSPLLVSLLFLSSPFSLLSHGLVHSAGHIQWTTSPTLDSSRRLWLHVPSYLQ